MLIVISIFLALLLLFLVFLGGISAIASNPVLGVIVLLLVAGYYFRKSLLRRQRKLRAKELAKNEVLQTALQKDGYRMEYVIDRYLERYPEDRTWTA